MSKSLRVTREGPVGVGRVGSEMGRDLPPHHSRYWPRGPPLGLARKESGSYWTSWAGVPGANWGRMRAMSVLKGSAPVAGEE